MLNYDACVIKYIIFASQLKRATAYLKKNTVPLLSVRLGKAEQQTAPADTGNKIKQVKNLNDTWSVTVKEDELIF